MALPKADETRADVDRPVAPLDWDQARAVLAGPLPECLNIAHASVDRHVEDGGGDRVALIWSGRHHQRRSFTYGELAGSAAAAAALLKSLGVRPGDTVAVLLGRVPELFVAALGAWKAGAVFCPLFTAFGPGPIRARLEMGRARVLIASDELYARKLASQRGLLPELEHVLLVGEAGAAAQPFAGCQDFRTSLAAADPAQGTTVATGPLDPALLHFTSGTTGTPKGAVHPHQVVLAHMVTGRQVFRLTPDDVYWCTGDPGWITSTAYGIVAPLVNGCSLFVDEADLDPRRWYSILRDEAVTAWYTTPTAIRTMMRHGAALARSYRRNSLRVAASVGEPLNAEAVFWGEKALGVPFLDTWWQTETGAITIGNLPGTARRPGSMGRPLPGIEAAVVRREGEAVQLLPEPETAGELALRAGVPSMFTGYLGDPERTGACFADGWYLTGDLVKRDVDGFFWFIGRSDDMLKSGGHQIGPFEVESMLMDHPAVAEVGVVGKPDLLLHEVPVAFVSLNPGFEGGDALKAELMSFARQEAGAAMAPREIHFIDALPKTSSGKILRRVLKARAMGETDDEPVPLQPCPSRFDDE